MSHVVLLGDSIFDNAAYVAGGPDVHDHLREVLPSNWKVSLLGEDGSVTYHVIDQLNRLAKDVTHLVISIGGNDALAKSGILNEGASSVFEVMGKLAKTKADFQSSYRTMLSMILAKGLPTTLCTIYYPQYPEPLFQEAAVAALSLFNDVIILETFAAGLPLIDLRLVCTEATDYANPIEPSVEGGAKIAAVIAWVIQQHDFRFKQTIVYK